METAFCIRCRDMRPYRLEISQVESTVRGVSFSYQEQAAYCTECGDLVYIPEVNDANVQARVDAYVLESRSRFAAERGQS
jgi:hypothetical protein